jgi:hypothetical protein
MMAIVLWLQPVASEQEDTAARKSVLPGPSPPAPGPGGL